MSFFEALLAGNVHNKVVCRIFSHSFWCSKKKKKCVIKSREMFSFLPLINNSVTIGLIFLLLTISTFISSKMINILRFLFEFHSLMFFKKSAVSYEY